MDDNKTFFTQVQAPVESETVEERLVKLPKTWVLWENYEAKSGRLDYKDSLKQIFIFNDIISFWQFWNAYPGSDPSFIFYNGERLRYFFDERHRINGLNLFVEGCRPEWEDPMNKGGVYFTLEYQVKNDQEIDRFLQLFKESWLKLMLSVIGDSIDAANYINGVRFIDKTQLGKKVMFRIEVWCNKTAPKEELTKLKEYIGKEFQSVPTEKIMQ